MNKNLIVFATYWNERDWIEASLAQIDALNPKEVIICDGCFDPKKPNYSTDGTREVIEAWVATHTNAHMISALRLSRWEGLHFLFWKELTWWNWPLRIVLSLYYLRTNTYRINQAATFTHMKRISKAWHSDDWFMTLDADQFYADETLARIKETLSAQETADLMTAKEKTFFKNFSEYTEEYEKRDYNNMPHRIKKNTLIVPTRDITLEKYPRPEVYGKSSTLRKVSVGTYFHYKFRPHDTARDAAGYTLGDRKKPDVGKFNMLPYTGAHPSVVQKLI